MPSHADPRSSHPAFDLAARNCDRPLVLAFLLMWTKAGMASARSACRPAKLAADQLVYARRMMVEGEGPAQVARSLGVDPSTLRRLLMKG
jgi:hypothetical protein